jgi:hypothetical protein
MSVMSLIATTLASKFFEKEYGIKNSKKFNPNVIHQTSEVVLWIMVMVILTPLFLNIQDNSGGYSEVLDASQNVQRLSHLFNSYIYAPLFITLTALILYGNRKERKLERAQILKTDSKDSI